MENQFSVFLNDWFENENWWFDCKHIYDDLIIQKYGYLLDEAVDSGNIDILARIIIYDQLPRHVFRNQDAAHIVTYFMMKAIEIVDTNIEEIKKLEGNRLCFALMPYRHRDTVTCFTNTLDIIWKKLKECEIEKTKDIYKRFLKASYERHDIRKHNCRIGISCYNWHYGEEEKLALDSLYKDILDYNGSYIDGRLLHDIILTDLPKKTYIVSLSGGVDSMVCCYCLQRSGYDVIAVHINYCNRGTSMKEEMFVRDWCYNNGVRLFVRRINEINRPLCMDNDLRETYETYTRNVRYFTYMNVAEHERVTGCNVVLGHNKDDCFENILTNINHKCKYDNLYGMETVTEQCNIVFYRPILNISKKDIIAYAQYQRIPYLYDSTPYWSQRGQIRDKIVPTLSAWDPGVIDSFFELSSYMKDMHSVLDIMMNMLIQTSSVTDAKDAKDAKVITLKLPDGFPIISNIMFWRDLIKKIPDIKKNPSKKSLECFVERLKKYDTNTEKINGQLTRMLSISVYRSQIILRVSR